jgi:flagellar P-ring protein precursor FlgI
VIAELPAYAHNGTRIDATASSVGDARSLQGGVLLPTALRGPAGQVIATAQGALSLGGFGGGTGGNNVQVNHLTVGRVPSGALVHTDVSTAVPPSDTIALSLKDPDFITADRISGRQPRARRRIGAPRDSATVSVRVPPNYRAMAELLARIEPLSVDVDAVARDQRAHGHGRRRRFGASRSSRRRGTCR